MLTPLGKWIRDLYRHPEDGLPYSPDGPTDERGMYVNLEALILSVRHAEKEIKRREDSGVPLELWELFSTDPELYTLLMNDPDAEGADADA